MFQPGMVSRARVIFALVEDPGMKFYFFDEGYQSAAIQKPDGHR